MEKQQASNLSFYEILKFPVSELYAIRHEDVILVHRGSFQVLYNSNENFFLLKHGDRKFALDKSLQVIGAYSDASRYPAYLIPSFDGFYMIKILDNTPDIALANLDTIFSNTCVFKTKTGMERKLGDIKENHIDTKLVAMREAIHIAKDTIVKTLTSHKNHPNYNLKRTFDELKLLVLDSIPVVDITQNDFERAKTETDEIIRNHQSNKYWTYFSDYKGDASSTQMSGSQDLTKKCQEDQKIIPKECVHDKGCDNIDTVKLHHATEQQEVVGTENQRLPAYEVHHTKEHVEDGLDKAVERLEDNKLLQHPDLPPVEECQIKEDTDLTTGLLRPLAAEEGQKFQEPEPIVDKNGNKQTLDANGDPYRTDLSEQILLTNLAPTSETYASDVSNPSETTAKLSEAIPSENASDFGNKPLVIQGNLSHSQSLTEKPLGTSPTKENMAFKQQNISEKHAMKQKNVSDQAGQKENATEYLV